MSTENIGKKVINIAELVDTFEAQEGEIQHIIGKIGNGKTYEGTRRALEDLQAGRTVYTTWRLILPDYYDQRNDKERVFWSLIFFRRRFYRFNYKDNWHFLDIDRTDLVEFLASLTDCIVYLDEGQDVFDSYEGTGTSKAKRKTLTRTRHLRKTLIIISQRATAVSVTARANVTYYFKTVKSVAWFWPFVPYFKVYRTEDMDDNNIPIWEDASTEWTAPLWHSHFAKSEVFNSYNSWYLRAGIPRSQTVSFEAYDLSLWDKIRALFARKPANIGGASEDFLKKTEEETAAKFKQMTTIEQKPKRKRKLSDVLPIDESKKGV